MIVEHQYRTAYRQAQNGKLILCFVYRKINGKRAKMPTPAMIHNRGGNIVCSTLGTEFFDDCPLADLTPENTFIDHCEEYSVSFNGCLTEEER